MKLLLIPFALVWLLVDWLRDLVRGRKATTDAPDRPAQRHLLTCEPVVSAIGGLRLEAWVRMPRGEAVDLYRQAAFDMPEEGDCVLAPLTMLPDDYRNRLHPHSRNPLLLETVLRDDGQRILLRARGTPDGVLNQLRACGTPGLSIDRQDGQPVSGRWTADGVFLHVAADATRKGAVQIGVIAADRLQAHLLRAVNGLLLALEGKQAADGDDAHLPDGPRCLPGKLLPLPCGEQLDIAVVPAQVRLHATMDVDGEQRPLEDIPPQELRRRVPGPLAQLPLTVRMNIGRYFMETSVHGNLAQLGRQLLAFVDDETERLSVGQERGYFAGGDFYAGGACVSVDDLSYGNALRIEVMSRTGLRAELRLQLGLLEARLSGA